MIFVCVGSREYQFNRLLEELDKLIAENKISEKVIAQIGQSTYLPKHYSYERFIDVEKFNELQQEADIVISHGGTGALIGALKKEKQVIAVPRLHKFGEHIDDHQLQVAEVLCEEGYLKTIFNIEELGLAINEIKENPIKKLYNKQANILEIINEFIN